MSSLSWETTLLISFLYPIIKGLNFKVKKFSPSKERICSVGSKSYLLTVQVQETKTAEYANSVDLDDVAHYEPLHLDLHCLPSSLSILNLI